MKASIILMVVILQYHSHSTMAISGFELQPTSVTQAEGVLASFLCRHPQTVAFGWNINGTALTLLDPRPPLITDGTVQLSDGMGGTVSTEALNVTAISIYNGTEIVCFAVLSNGTKDFSSPAILTVQGPVDGPSALFANSEMPAKIVISWIPPFTLNLTNTRPDIAYCVDVYNITNGGLIYLSSNCSILLPSYTFTVENPDPEDEFDFMVTPRSNVEGARNGTRSQITGRFSLQKPLVNGIPKAYLLITMLNNTATINIEFTNDVISRAPIRRPENYSVMIQLINPPDSDIIVCPTIINFETESLTSLTLSCVKPLQNEQLGLVTIFVSNAAGDATILENQELSTHYIQNVSVSEGGLPGEATVSLDILGGDVMGYLAIANGGLRVGYRVAERRSGLGNQIDTITNLASGDYSTSVFTINHSGLPQVFSVSLPRTVRITASGMQTLTSSQPSTSVVNVSDVQSLNAGELCYDCSFMDSNMHTNSTCVVVAHPCGVSSLYPGLFNISITKFTRSGNSARGCVDISRCEVGYYAAVFYFNGERGMIEGSPLAKMSPTEDVDIVVNSSGTNIVLPVALTLLFALISVVLVVIVVIMLLWKKDRMLTSKGSDKPSDSPEQGTDHDSTEYDDPSCTISTHDLIKPPDPEPVYEKPVGSPKRSPLKECHYAETTVTSVAGTTPQPFEPPPRIEYAEVCGYKNKEGQQYAMLQTKTPAKEGTPENKHKVEYSEINTGPQITQANHDKEDESDCEDHPPNQDTSVFTAVANSSDLDTSIFTTQTSGNDPDDFDALESFLAGEQISSTISQEYSS